VNPRLHRLMDRPFSPRFNRLFAAQSRGQTIVFDPDGKHGEFGKRLLPMYLDITKYVLDLAAGSSSLATIKRNGDQICF
jgi:hypothetical protein